MKLSNKELSEKQVTMVDLYKPEITSIYNIVIKYFKISVVDDACKEHDEVLVRQLTHFFSKKHTSAPLNVIGYIIGNKDHNTVRHSIKTIENYIDTNSKFRQIFDNVKVKVDNFYLGIPDEIEVESEEIWKDIPGYEGLYQLSSKMNIRSIDRVVNYKEIWEKHIRGQRLVVHKKYKVYLTCKDHRSRKHSLIDLYSKTFV